MKDKKYFVYILECSDKTYYTGYTDNIENRLKKHNGTLKGGAKYTSSRRPVTPVYIKKFTNKLTALKYERELKLLDRKGKEKIIGKSNPIFSLRNPKQEQ